MDNVTMDGKLWLVCSAMLWNIFYCVEIKAERSSIFNKRSIVVVKGTALFFITLRNLVKWIVYFRFLRQINGK